MCGVFGFVSKNREPLSMNVLRKIAKVTESRGPHAWGLAWVDQADRIHAFKQSGRISDRLGLLAMAQDAKMLIGHCRYATHGHPSNNANNHPHPADGGWVIHNGVISRHREIAKEYGLRPMTACDSEVLGLLIEKLDGSLLDRCRQTADIAKGWSPFVMMGLWRDRLIVAKANRQPLHQGETDDAYYLASLADGLPGEVAEFYDNEVFEFGESDHDLFDAAEQQST